MCVETTFLQRRDESCQGETWSDACLFSLWFAGTFSFPLFASTRPYGNWGLSDEQLAQTFIWEIVIKIIFFDLFSFIFVNCMGISEQIRLLRFFWWQVSVCWGCSAFWLVVSVGNAGFDQWGNDRGWFGSSAVDQSLVPILLSDLHFFFPLPVPIPKKHQVGGKVYQQGADKKSLNEESDCRWVCKCWLFVWARGNPGRNPGSREPAAAPVAGVCSHEQ